MDYNILEYKERLKHIEELLEREEDINLEQAANYLLNSKDIEKPKKLQYKIFDDEDLFRKRLKEVYVTDLYNENGENELDILVQKVATRSENKPEIFVNDTIRESIRINGEIQVKHFKSDMSNIYLKQYQDAITSYMQSKSYKSKKAMKELKYDQKLTKNSLYGTIYFKHISKTSTEYDLDVINFADPEHIKVLLKYPNNRLDTWIGCLSATLDELICDTKLTDLQSQILKLWGCEDIKQEDIAVEVGMSQDNVSHYLRDIVDKIIKVYEENFEDYKYTYWVKGKYKTCSKCKEVKLICEFSPDKRNKDGLQGKCKDCDNSRKTLHKKRS